MRKYSISALRFPVDFDSDLVQKSVETYFVRMVLLGVGFVTSVVVARALGPAGRGHFAVAMVIGALGVQFGNLGLHVANTYYVARDKTLLPKLWGNSLWVSAAFGLILGLAAFLLQSQIPTLSLIRGRLLLLAAIWIPIGLAFLLGQNLLLGMQQIRFYNVTECVNRFLTLGLLLLVVWSKRISTEAMFSVTLFSMLLALLTVAFYLNRVSPESLSHSMSLFKRNFQYGMRAYWGALFSFLVLRADMLLVQKMLGPEQSGYYGIAVNMCDYILILPTVISSILLPKLAAHRNNLHKLEMTTKAFVGTALILIPLLVAFGLAARILIPVLFGEAFRSSIPAFMWLLPGMLFLGLHTVSVQYLNSIGYPKEVVWAWGLCAFLNVLMNLWAIPVYGISGASVVSSVCYFLAFVAILVIVYNHRKFDDHLKSTT